MSGAQAAAGDLLRARKAKDDDVDEELIAAASATFIAFEAYYKARRTYDVTHPAVDRMFRQLEDKLRPALARYGEIEVAVTAKCLEIGGHAVSNADRPETNMWFPLYRDGIRELSFAEGVDQDQISRFCDAVAVLASMKPGSEEDDGEDDAVTMLWDLALEDIGYVAIDSFVDSSAADEETRARIEKIRDMVTMSMMKELVVPPDGAMAGDLEAARRLRSIALSKADLRVLERENLAALDEIPLRMREAQASLFRIDDGERAALAQGIGDDPQLVEKLLDALIYALLAGGERTHTETLCARVEHAFTALVVEGKLERATTLRRTVIAAARGGADPEMFALLDRAMSAAAAIQAIADALHARDDAGLAIVIALVEVLPPVCAPPLLRALVRVEQRKRRRAVCDIVARWGQVALDGALAALPDSPEELALDLLYLLRVVGTDAAAVALERATHHAAPAIRAGALRLFAEVAPPAQLVSRTRAALCDDDPIVRSAALEIIVDRRPDGAVRWIDALIDDESFGAREIGEKKRLFVAYATLGGAEVGAKLLARLGQRNLLQRASVDEERAAAASALGVLRYEPARPALERIARGVMVRSLLKTACSEALAELDRGGPSPAAAASARAARTTMMPPLDLGAAGDAPDTELTLEPPPMPAQPLELLEHVTPTSLPAAPVVTFKSTTKIPRIDLGAATAPPPAAQAAPPPAAQPVPAHKAPTQRVPVASPQQPTQQLPVAARPVPTARPHAPTQPVPTALLRDPRSASGRMPVDDGVVAKPKTQPVPTTVLRDTRSASGKMPVDDGVVVPRARVATPAGSQPVRTVPGAAPAEPRAPADPRAPKRPPVAAEDDRGVPRSDPRSPTRKRDE